MVQIIGLRPYFNKEKNKEDTRHELFTTVESVPQLFKDLSSVIEKIPEHERWNVYFTCLDCQDPRLVKGRLRSFKAQEIFPFDIDGIALEKRDQYIDAFFDTLKFDRSKTVVICSGNGLQFFVQLAEAFTDASYFAEKREHYKAICERVNKALAERGLPGNADPSVWSPARIMRLPNTENRKKGKEPKKAFVIGGQLAPQSIEWQALSGLPDILEDDAVEWNDTKAPKLDHKEMYKECKFLQATLTDTKDFHEPHYYAALSIIGRMENGQERARTLRDQVRKDGGSPTVSAYSDADVSKKLDQALKNSGPRTCKNINDIWGKCGECPQFNKCVSPVSLKGKEHIATRDTGFHYLTKNGPIPAYQDLLKFFDEKHSHKTLNQNGLVFAWVGTHYELMSKHQILNFAHTHFDPKPKSNVCEEFLKLTQRTNLVDADFFAKNLNGKLNFSNGVYDFHTKKLSPHSPEFGFRYVLPYAFDPTAKAPRFEKFLEEVTNGDKDLQAILEEFGGFALSGDEYWIHKTLFLLGEGANGKSTFIDVLKLCAGSKNYSTVSLKDLSSENNRQLLEGKLFNIAPELSKDALKDTEKFKYLSDGSEITVKLMWNQPYQIRNRAKMIYACNAIPEAGEAGYAFMRRLVIVPFGVTFDGANKDDQIIHKLEKELPGIMNVFIRGYERLLKNRAFTEAQQEDDQKDLIKSDSNLVKEFFDTTDDIIVHPLNGRCHFAKTFDIKKRFELWALNNGVIKEAEKITTSVFGRMLQQAIKDGAKRASYEKINGKKWRGYFDVEITKND